MAGYADVMKKIVNEANEDVLDVVCGAYMCTVDYKDKVNEPAVIVADDLKYQTKELLGKRTKNATYNLTLYSCDEERARQGKKSWIAVGTGVVGLLEYELAAIKTKQDAMDMIKMAIAAGFDYMHGLVIKSMDIMSDADEQKFRDDIVTREELMEEMFGVCDDDDDDDDEDDEYDEEDDY
jgi:hypothetical protein